MKKKTTSTKKRLSGQRYLIWGLALVCVFGIAFFSRQSSVIDAEREGFMKLKQDFLSLQAEFNTIDPGWEYSEGCVGRGVFTRMKATSCSITLLNRSVTDKSQINQYIDRINKQPYFSQISITRSDATSYSLSSKNNPKAGCDITYSYDSINENPTKSYLTIGCKADSHEFYFPRTD